MEKDLSSLQLLLIKVRCMRSDTSTLKKTEISLAQHLLHRRLWRDFMLYVTCESFGLIRTIVIDFETHGFHITKVSNSLAKPTSSSPCQSAFPELVIFF